LPNYTPPLDNIRFILNDVLNAGALANEIPEYEDADWETVSGMLSEVGKFASEVIFPLNQKGDTGGASYNHKDKTVTTSKKMRDAAEAYAELGLQALVGSPEYGGLGMPNYLNVAINEMMCTNISFTIRPSLTTSACRALEKFGTDELKSTYIEKMLSGQWNGAMCLTEPNAGTDLGLIRTKAEPQEDGSYKVTGNKIFISYGDHDIAENICHMVLARIPDGPPGIKGISLFAIPKFIPDENGEVGERNEVWCTGIEEKMGIHASPTCSMSYEGAKGWLVGEPHKGMQAMFTMMNDARTNVGIQGIAISEAAYQQIAEYTNERVQGKPITQANNPSAKSVPIINHSNIRKSLMDMRAQIEASRAMALDMAVTLDLAEKHPDKDVRKNAENHAALMTPIIKACFTDMSVAISTKAQELHGGVGFITETGVDQYVRDSVVSTIYEGTNDVQSIDFTFRKVLDPNDEFKRIGMFMDTLRNEIKTAKENPALSGNADTLEEAMNVFSETTGTLMRAGMDKRVEDILVHSRDFMDMFHKLAMGRIWLKMMSTAHEKLTQGTACIRGKQADFYQDKLDLGEHYMERIMMPDIKKLEMRIEAGATTAVKSSVDNLVPGNDIGIGSDKNDNDKKAGFTLNF
jgi:alkylation response protein AidB-like acyl-CoA dehydrogenase